MTRLLQCVCGRYTPLLKAVEPHHAAYCKRWGFQYRPIYYPKCGKNHWYSKHSTITNDLVEMSDGDLLIWLDLDALIVSFNEDVSKAIPDGYDLALCPVRFDIAVRWGKYNVGAQWIRVSPETRAFYKLVQDTAQNDKWIDQEVINRELPRSGLRVHDLDSRFNRYGGNLLPSAFRTVVKAWHGKDAFASHLDILGAIYHADVS